MKTPIFGTGTVALPGRKTPVSELQWNAHPSFKGVFLKHLIAGNDTGNLVSYHLVRVEPGCEIGKHVHAGKMEIHEVVSGSGYCSMNGASVQYEPGMIVQIPADEEHCVVAGDTGLHLLAKFFPALL